MDVLRVLRDLVHHTDMTMLVVTHEMNFAKDISDRVFMFDSGSIVESGPPEQIFTDPKHNRTRAFPRAIIEAT
jgi:polar amino acid transport system ATP-binding protein